MSQQILTAILLAIFFFSAAGVILIGIWLYRKGPLSKQQKRISQFVTPETDIKSTETVQDAKKSPDVDVSKARDWINNSLSSLSSDKLKLKLSSVYWEITDTEFLLITIVAATFAFLLGWVILRNFLLGLFLCVLAVLLPRLILDRAIAKRQQRFHTQLLDVLVMITGAVKAGYSFMQALDLAVKEVPAPASEEFGRVLREIRLGISLEETLFNLARRMENDDLQIVVTAIIINAQVGGNLSTVLEASISTIRDRLQLMGEIRSLTSYARYVGYFLTFLPFAAGAIIFLIMPDYFDTVRTSLLTQIIFFMALLGIIIGNFWMRRIIRIKV